MRNGVAADIRAHETNWCQPDSSENTAVIELGRHLYVSEAQPQSIAVFATTKNKKGDDGCGRFMEQN